MAAIVATVEPDAPLTELARAAMPFAGELAIEMLTAGPEEVRARLAWEQRLCTAGGVLHGGVLMGLADTVGAYCAFLNLPEGSTATATIESKTNFFAAVRSGLVEARSRPLHRGSRTISRPTSSTRAASTLPASRRRRPFSDVWYDVWQWSRRRSTCPTS